MPKLTILTPAFNCARYIEGCISSVANQTFREFEHIIMDGGSADGTVEILKKHPHLQWASEPDEGEADALNKAIDRSTGDIFGWLNADDFYYSNEVFQWVTDAFAQVPDCHLIYGNVMLTDEAGKPQGLRLVNAPISLYQVLRFFRHIHVAQPAMFFSRQLLEKVGKFDTELEYSIDLDFWLRIAHQGFTWTHIDRVIAGVRLLRQDGKTASPQRVKEDEWLATSERYLRHLPRIEQIAFWREYYRWRFETGDRNLRSEEIVASHAKQVGLALATIDLGQVHKLAPLFEKLLREGVGAPELRWFHGEALTNDGQAAAAAQLLAQPGNTAIGTGAVSVPHMVAPHKTSAEEVKKTKLRSSTGPKVDVVLPPGLHSWNVGNGWVNTLKRQGMLHEAYQAQPDRIEDMLRYFKDPKADVVLLLGFDHHIRFLHEDPKLRDFWRSTKIFKVLMSQETILQDCYPGADKSTESALSCVDMAVFNTANDAKFFANYSTPSFWQPFGVDELVFTASNPFGHRLHKAYFRGKTKPIGLPHTYERRRQLLRILLERKLVDYTEFAYSQNVQELVAEFNRYQIALNLPAVFQGLTTRVFESLACGCLLVTPGLPHPSEAAIFENGKHLYFYDPAHENDLISRLTYALEDVEGSSAVAEAGRCHVLESHTLQHRFDQILKKINDVQSGHWKGGLAEADEKGNKGTSRKAEVSPRITPSIQQGVEEQISNYQFGSEQKEQLMVRHQIKPGMVVFDVGANIGEYTKLFSLLVGQTGKVHAFEPAPKAFDSLTKLIAAESLSNVHANNCAVDWTTGTVRLNQFPDEYCAWNSIGAPAMENPKDTSRFVPINSTVEVQAITLDEYCREQGITKIDFLKLDVEGAEIYALEGARELLDRRAIACLQFEVSQKMLEGLHTSARLVFDYLRDKGYECHTIQPDGQVGMVVSDSSEFYENYVAFPMARFSHPELSTPPLPVHFFSIVLDGEPFIRHHIEVFSKLRFPWHWHVVEGVAELNHDTGWSLQSGGKISPELHHNGLSNDGTSEYLDEIARRFPNNVTLYRKPNGEFWDGKLEMVNAPLKNIKEHCLLWQVDADELWTADQICAARYLFSNQPKKTAAYFFAYYYVGEELLTSTRGTYGNQTQYEWLRLWRFRPGCRWASHEPPRLIASESDGHIDLATIDPILHDVTEARGLVFQHYAYATKAQLRFKEIYYGYKDALQSWLKLQEVLTTPALLRDYLPWVKDNTRVSHIGELNVWPVARKNIRGNWRFRSAAIGHNYPRTIVLVRSDSIGDSVLASSIVAQVASKYRHSKIVVVCQDQVAPLYQASPAVDRVISFDRRKLISEEEYRIKLAEQLSSIKAELCLNPVFSRDVVSDFLAVHTKAGCRVAFEGGDENMTRDQLKESNRAYTHLIPNGPLRWKPELERVKDYLTGIGVAGSLPEPTVWLEDADEAYATEFFRASGFEPGSTIALFAGAQYANRIYKGYGRALSLLCRTRRLTVVALGSGKDFQLNQEQLNEIGVQCVNLSGKTTLRQAAAILKKCLLAVGAETGLAHISCAVGLPNVILVGGGHFGRFMPYSPLTSVVCLPLECYGCNWQCRFSHEHCVKDVSSTVIEEAIRVTLNEKSQKPRVFVQAHEDWKTSAGMPSWRGFDHFLNTLSVETITVRTKLDDCSQQSPARNVPARKEEISVIVRTAEVASEKGEISSAREILERALNDNPGSIDLLNALAEANLRSSSFSDAFKQFGQLAELQPESVHHLIGRAKAALGLDKIDEFESSLGHALRLNPNDLEALRLLADLNYQNGSIKDAAELYLRITKLNPEDLEALIALGSCFQKTNDLETALLVFEKALAVAPENRRAKDLLQKVQHKRDHITDKNSGPQELSKERQLDELLEEACKEERKGNITAARALLNKAAEIYPNNPAVLGMRASICFSEQDYIGAREGFEQLSRLRPDDATVQAQLALTYLRLERIDQFELALGRALEIDPYHRESLKLLGDLNFQNGRLKDAAHAYTKILSRDPKDVEAMLPLAVCFFKDGDLETSETVFNRVLEIDPNNKLAKENLEVISRKKSPSGMRPLIPTPVFTSSPLPPAPQPPSSFSKPSNQTPASGLEAKIETDIFSKISIPELHKTPATPKPLNPKVNKLVEEAGFFQEVGNIGAALENLEEACELAPNDPGILDALGSLYFTQENYDAARQRFRKLIELRPRDPSVYTRLAMSCLKLDRIEEMESALGLALEIDPNNRDALKFLAKTNLENNRLQDAGRIYSRLLEKDGRDMESLLSLALCFFKAGDLAAARMVYERALEADPTNETALENIELLSQREKTTIPKLAKAAPAAAEDKAALIKRHLSAAEKAFNEGNEIAASASLKEILKLTPDAPDILTALGSLSFQAGDYLEAKACFRKLVDQAPDDVNRWVQLATVLHRLNEVQAFEEALGKALELDPNHIEGLRLLAYLNFNHGSITDAAHTYGKILRQTPNDIECLMALGVCFHKVADFEAAKMMFERVLELEPNHTTASENLKVANSKLTPLKPTDSKITPVDFSGLQIPPIPSFGETRKEKRSLNELICEADAKLTAGDLIGASVLLEEARSISPNDTEISATVGSLYFQLGEFEKSFEPLKNAAYLMGTSADFYTRAALSALMLERISEFETALGKALELDPNYRPALKLLADLNFRNQKYKDAAYTYNRLLRQTPCDLDILIPLGVCFYKVNDLDAARLLFSKAVELCPENEIASENLRLCERKLAERSERKEAGAKKPSLPLVSAIVSTYNSERFIRGCLEDLESQTIADQLEIIVIDSASQQNERAVVQEFQKRYQNIIYVRTEDRETVYAAWNRGIRLAKGKYITNANTDDRHRSDAFEVMVQHLEKNPEIALVYADVWITVEENKTFETAQRAGLYKWHDFDPAALVDRGCFVGPQPMWRKEVHDKEGFFDPEFVSAGDYEFWMRLAKKRKFFHIKETLGVYLKSPTSVEHSNQERAAKEVEIARSRHASDLLRNAGIEIKTNPEQKIIGKDIVVPPVGRIASLKKVHDLVERKKFLKAWNAALEAISIRPFHPDAYLQMVDIALAAGDEREALICAERLIAMTPKWDLARKVYASLKSQKNLRQSKINWSSLPALPGKPRISVCLIAKNEEEFIERCLNSVKPFASQIVLVDTGSTDRTVEIAKRCGAEVHHFPWNDNFADARNAAHEHARGDWVLILDADEELPKESHEKLWHDVSASNILGYRIPICNLHESSDSVTYVPRLFRNAPALFFVGRVHEQIYASIVARSSEWGMDATMGTAMIIHHGYDPGLVKRRQKVQRNLRLMEKAVQELPGEAALMMNYGLDLVNDGRLEEGLAKYRQAVRILEPHHASAVLPEVRERLVTLFGVHLMKADRFGECLELMQSRLANDSGPTASMDFMAAVALMKLNRSNEAIPYIKSCIEKKDLPTLTPACHELRKSAPFQMLAECQFKAGNNQQAEQCFKKALELEPNSPTAIHDFAFFLHKQERSFEAIQTLQGAIGLGINDERIWHLGSFVANSRPDFIEFAVDWTTEALKFWPANDAIRGLHAEALLKVGRLKEALPFFDQAARNGTISAKAATILCQLGLGERPSSVSADEETKVSLEFVGWYRRLLISGAKETVNQLNADIKQIKLSLPTAARAIEQALTEEE